MDNFVNLVVVRDPLSIARAELLRVLVPNGVAVFVTDHGQLTTDKLVKPRPADIDDWTHFLHGPDNNAVARDRRVDIPRSIQWVSEPRWGRSHEELASMSAAVTAGGRIFYIVDEAPVASLVVGIHRHGVEVRAPRPPRKRVVAHSSSASSSTSGPPGGHG